MRRDAFAGGGRRRPALPARGLAEQDEQRDDQREQRDGFHQREAQHGHGEDLAPRRRVAPDRHDEGREDVADADTGADHTDDGQTGADHFRGFEFHWYSSL